MVKVWRQVQESHCEGYLQRKDLYTTLLSQYNKPGKITRSLCQQFQRPPARREPPSARLMRKAFLISEADNIEDYRTQIMSTFGQVLKYDSTKKICKKLSGDGKGTAEWCTNVANEHGQILISVLTCEESLEKMRPMAEGLMERYRRADEAPPELMYVDRGCCRVHAVSSVEQLFSDWTDRGMLVRLSLDPSIRCSPTDRSSSKVCPVQVCPLCCRLCLQQRRHGSSGTGDTCRSPNQLCLPD
ncbi:uncharacterized protein [Danio rerio]|uniref:Uncharacterized protein n=1 Tax=Danio rerio TaxID=7955 RepID=A0A8M9QCK7_DANRE|nr:uncharacterized protein LOC110439495 [Danio rerio]|eukprot:XP_021331250.1 uncharacterized protein LOC110439495 [Danio rerio]